MDAAWLASVAAAATLSLLLIVRSNRSPSTKRIWGIAWAVTTIVAAIGLDVAYPRVQRSSAVAMIHTLGGSAAQNDDGEILIR